MEKGNIRDAADGVIQHWTGSSRYCLRLGFGGSISRNINGKDKGQSIASLCLVNGDIATRL